MAPCWSVTGRVHAPLGLGGPTVRFQMARSPGPAAMRASRARTTAETWTLHATPEWSREGLEREPGDIGPALLDGARRQLGRAILVPSYLAAHRWRTPGRASRRRALPVGPGLAPRPLRGLVPGSAGRGGIPVRHGAGGANGARPCKPHGPAIDRRHLSRGRQACALLCPVPDLASGHSPAEDQPEQESGMAMPTFTMRQLLEAGVHFGHHTRRWNPKMAPYIFGVRNGVHIIDLTQTVPMLHRALAASATSSPPAAACCSSAPSGSRGKRRRGRQALRPVLRQPPLARRHADQLEDHLALDQAPARDGRELAAGDAAGLTKKELLNLTPRAATSSSARWAASRRWAACPTCCS